MSNDTTSSSTSSMKFAVMVNFNLHFLVTCSFALSHNQPKGYGLGCGMVSKLNLMTMFSKTKFSCETISNKVSILLCFEMTLIWKISILTFSL